MYSHHTGDGVIATIKAKTGANCPSCSVGKQYNLTYNPSAPARWEYVAGGLIVVNLQRDSRGAWRLQYRNSECCPNAVGVTAFAKQKSVQGSPLLIVFDVTVALAMGSCGPCVLTMEVTE